MTKATRLAPKDQAPPEPTPAPNEVKETPFGAIASICLVLVVGLFILTFLAENFVIPSGSMENTLLIGDHLIVDRITLSPLAKWIEPLVYYREPRHNDVVVFFKPVFQPGVDSVDTNGQVQYPYLVKRLIGLPGDHIHLRNGIVFINGVAQPPPKDSIENAGPTIDEQFLDEFPSIPPAEAPSGAATESWAVDEPRHVVDGDLVVPPGMYFMMGDNRHNSLDSRYWGFVPRANIIGRPLFNYWSFRTPETEYELHGTSNKLEWMAQVALHFFTGTRWKRTFHIIH